MSLVLIGPPGAGKSTVGALVAQRLGVDFIDNDQAIEASQGKSVAEIFATDGEAGFRQLEVKTALSLLKFQTTIVALGGGAITQPAIVKALADWDVVLWLDVSVEEASLRLAAEPGQRPLLDGDLPGRLSTLMNERRRQYAAVATNRIDTTGLTEAEAVEGVLALAETYTSNIEVKTAQPYPVLIGHGVISGLAGFVCQANKVAIVSTPALSALTVQVEREILAAGVQVYRLEIPDGEAAKNAETLTQSWIKLAEAGLTRSDLIIGVGGGATTDIAGFLAASYLRGISWIAVPTTVLGMVDAAIGGKTGIDLPQGKNLVGAFHQPLAVLSDLDTLASLPLAEFRSGLAEAAKVGFTDDPKILDLIEANPPEVLDFSSARLAEIITRAVEVKTRVVADDAYERTSTDVVGRERLNYGHTLAHAIEAHEDYSWRHGEAVAVGAVFAAELASRLTELPRDLVDRHRSIYSALGLTISYNQAVWEDLQTITARDKKARGQALRFVLLEGLGQVVIATDPPESALRQAYQAIAS